VGGGVEFDEPVRADRVDECFAQGGADAVQGRVGDGALAFDGGAQMRIAPCAGGGDGGVAFADGVEHGLDVGDA
jgi:hypothetical protein